MAKSRNSRTRRPATGADPNAPLQSVGTTIAQRAYRRGRERVVAKLGQPQRFEDGNWFCPYQIVGLGDGKVRRAWAVDSVQALELGLQAVRAHLVPHADELSLWGKKGLIAISRPLPDGYGPKFNKGMERIADAMVAAYGEALERGARGRSAKSLRRRRR